MTKLRLLLTVLSLSLLLDGCAYSGQYPVAGEPLAMVKAGTRSKNSTPPVIEDFVFHVLAAELAGQRGQLAASVDHYLTAARISHDPRVAERATRVAVFARDNKKALEAAKLWLQEEPKSLEARQILAVLLMRNGETDAAYAQLESVLAAAQQESPGQGFTFIAALLGREQDREAALALMSRLVEKYPKQPDALFAYSHLAMRAGHPDEAMVAVDRALKLRPHWPNAVILKARILQLQGKYDESLDYLASTVRKHPADSSLRLSYARLLLDAKRYEQAREQFAELARREPDNADVLFALGVLYLQAEKGPQAKEYFLRLIKLGKRVPDASFYLGQIAEVEGNTPEALKWYRAVDRGDNALDAQIRVAALMADEGDLDGARDHLHTIEARTPEQSVRLTLVEGELLREAGKLQDAMEVFNQALEEMPGNADLLYARAMTAERMNRLDVLERDLRAILAEDPNHVQALNALGYSLAERTDRLAEALDYIKRALALKPNDFYILDSMGWVQYRLGNYREAVSYLRRALAIKNDPEVAAHLGEVLWAMGDKEGARKAWRDGLDAKPQAPEIIEVMKRLGEH